MNKMILFLAGTLLFGFMSVGQVKAGGIDLQGIADEFKSFSWKTSIGGDVVYLINEGQLYGGIGFDIAQSPHEWAKIRAGYLPSPKRFGYVGIQLNGGKAIAKLLANMTSVKVQEFMEKALLNIGIQYAVNPNDWEQDYGLLLTILKWDF